MSWHVNIYMGSSKVKIKPGNLKETIILNDEIVNTNNFSIELGIYSNSTYVLAVIE